ncbi:MAG: 50S ribosomal protein L25 [Bacteroidetes bacterium HGW-Bacteroidetes-1]|jgi:large subunit ribosomal protein L25|nr:MAG: 50S ribosomal protein L25 [Bacteroidetes bacterium HGW-Bacteroidetes-1]
MKKVSLSGSLRENVGKKDAKNIRKVGQVPCVIYGGTEQIHFQVAIADFKPILFTPETYVIQIVLGGKTYNTILKEAQYHPVGDQVIHADFFEINEANPVVVALPVKVKGTSPGVIRGGKLKIKLVRLIVKGLIASLPEFIEVNVSKLNVGQSIKVRNLKLENVTFLNDANAVVVEVKAARGIVLSDDEEAEAPVA